MITSSYDDECNESTFNVELMAVCVISWTLCTVTPSRDSTGVGLKIPQPCAVLERTQPQDTELLQNSQSCKEYTAAIIGSLWESRSDCPNTLQSHRLAINKGAYHAISAIDYSFSCELYCKVEL